MGEKRGTDQSTSAGEVRRKEEAMIYHCCAPGSECRANYQPPAAREERAVLSRCAFVFRDGGVCGDDAAHPKHFNHYNHDYVPPAAELSLRSGTGATAPEPSLRDGTREEERVRRAALALQERMDEIEPMTDGVWSLYHIHGGTWPEGLNWKAERDALRAALNADKAGK